MQELEHIEVGQQANDGTGDPLRDGMIKVNANFAKVQSGVDAVELAATSAAQTANEAKTTADGAIPAAQKGVAGGVAPLDATGKVPSSHLPEPEDYIPLEEKGVAGGVAPLDANGKVPAVNLPAAEDSIPLTQKGVADGVATLDSNGKVPAAQLAAAVLASSRGVAGGVATLDGDARVPLAQMPSGYAGAVSGAFGVTQTFQDVKATRALDVVYTNSTGRPISIYVRTTAGSSGGQLILWIDNIPFGIAYYNASTTGLSVNAVIPPGATYRVTTNGPTITDWKEYR